MTTVGLEHMPFPYAFPQPPANAASPPSDTDVDTSQLSSWMYYLSETSLRRIGNEIASAFYTQCPSTWIKDISSLHVQVEQLSQKLDTW